MKLKTIYMNKSKRLFCKLAFAALGILPTMATTALADTTDYTQYVNPFVGNADNGHTFPGACRPFGMIQTSPVTGAVGWRYCSEYVYSDSLIWGFTQTHLNGTGCMDLGDILVMPTSGKRTRAWDGYRSRYSKQQEFATPGYYSVYLTDAKVKAELTAAPHVAFHRYTFDNPDSTSVFIDLQHAPAWRDEQYHSQCISCETKWEDAQTLTGHVRNKVWVDQDYFFVMKFNRPVVSHIQLPKAVDTERGQRIVATFDIPRGEQLLVKVAMSTTSVEGARLNLETEVPDWNFAEVTRTAHNEWNSYLSRIDVTGTDTDKQNYYTAFYHALIQPNQIADVDGKYRNADNKVVCSSNGEFYSTFSCWDTYRAAHPFYTMVIPERVDGLVNSLVEQAEVQGFLPIWGLWGKENFCMIGNHAVSIVAEAYHKGFRGFDAERAFNAIKRTQTVNHGEKYDWETYMKYGYWPTDLVASESVSNSLECMYDDYAAADMARLMGKKQDQQYFARRANFYKNLFDKQTNFMRPRLADGSWRSPFNPSNVAHAETVGGDYTEGNAWQYTFLVPHDVKGLIQLFGSDKAFMSKLDSLFFVEGWAGDNASPDMSGMTGQYAHGNEPSHHVIYMYNYAGRPDKAAPLLRKMLNEMYLDQPDGLSGNEDVGQMSAWYILSSVGLYQVDPVGGRFVIGSPLFDKATVNVGAGKTFTVVAKNNSDRNIYVQSARLNGKALKNSYIDFNDIRHGGTLELVMGPKPSKWATAAACRP